MNVLQNKCSLKKKKKYWKEQGWSMKGGLQESSKKSAVQAAFMFVYQMRYGRFMKKQTSKTNKQ